MKSHSKQDIEPKVVLRAAAIKTALDDAFDALGTLGNEVDWVWEANEEDAAADEAAVQTALEAALDDAFDALFVFRALMRGAS